MVETLNSISSDIVVSLIGLIGMIVTGIFGFIKVRNSAHKLSQAESELTLQQKALDFGAFMEEWSGTHEDILHLLEKTSIDRFLIFRAWNGRLAPRWTTAIFQMRLGEQEPVSYVHFELDVDYVSRLKEVSVSNFVSFEVEKLPNCAIKSVYQAEGVKHAVWCHIMSEEVSGSDTVAHTYCSFATHVEEPIDPSVITRCTILAGRLKGIAYSFNN